MRFLFFAFLFCSLCRSISAQHMASMSSAEMLWQLEAIGNTASVLYIAAHPDDENTRLISYLANEEKIRTAYLSLTRGDGGQNLIGTEQGPALGMLRTQELLAARRIDRGLQFFTRAYDFGYSKTPEETLEKWNKDSVLADIVYVIRSFRPDVIICRFPSTGEGGHGHHTASAILAQEAFVAAADPQRFPHQLSQLSVWQVKRLLWNTFNFGGNNTTSEDQLKIDVGGREPLLGEYNGVIAARSRSQHKSQGFGSLSSRGSQWEYFKPILGEPPQKYLWDGIVTDWTRYPKAGEIAPLINLLQSSFDVHQPEASLPLLHELRHALIGFKRTTPEAKATCEWALDKVEQLILQSAGIWMEANSPTPAISPGAQMNVDFQVLSTQSNTSIINWKLSNRDSLINYKLQPNVPFHLPISLKVSGNATPTRPFWLPQIPKSGMYEIANPSLNTKPENDPEWEIKVLLGMGEDTMTVSVPLLHKYGDPVKGEIYEPLHIVPAFTLSLPQSHFLFTGNVEQTIPVTVEAHTDNIKTHLKVKAPKGWSADWEHSSINLSRKGDRQVLTLKLHPSRDAQSGNLEFYSMEDNQPVYSITRINYDHIPTQQWAQKVSVRLELANLKRTPKKIGYLPGAGDEVAQLLKSLGLDVHILEVTDAQQDYSQYDVLLCGVRAFNVNESLIQSHPQLMKYVESGGTLVVQYNTNSRAGPLNAEIGPYPFQISRNRVTDEQSEVVFLQPNHPIMSEPNIISSKDFEGWVQERGIYFAEQTHDRYIPLFAMKDKGEAPHSGSTIVTTYGKGKFIYTGLSFFRQLPAGVPGAYKLLINFLHW